MNVGHDLILDPRLYIGDVWAIIFRLRKGYRPATKTDCAYILFFSFNDRNTNLLMTRAGKLCFCVIVPSGVYVTTARPALHPQRQKEGFDCSVYSGHVTHVPLYCDVVIGGEEMKCLRAVRCVWLEGGGSLRCKREGLCV